MKLKNILIVYTIPTNKAQRLTLDLVKNTLIKNKIRFDISVREKLNKKLFQNRDLVIVVGGDGTYLMASHYIFDKTLVLGVNSDPLYKEGFFMRADKSDFEKKLKLILNDKFRIKKLHRVEAYIYNKKISELALNEFYVASKVPYHTARYYLTIRGKRERQKSSGILISSAAGTYAWMKSAGGKTLPLESNKFEYLIREPYCGRTAAKCSMVNGILNNNERIEVKIEFGYGVIIADSTGKENEFDSKQKVTIKMSNKPIHLVSFDK